MRHITLATVIPLAVALAFGSADRALAANPAPKSEPTAEDAHWLAAASARRITRNGASLNGHTVRSDGGMTVVSIRLPGAARHAK